MNVTVKEDEKGEPEGLLFRIETPGEWQLMLSMPYDAKGEEPGWLTKRFGVLMDDEDWDDFLAPELAQRFTDEIEKVKKVIEEAFAAARPLLDAFKSAAEKEYEENVDEEEEVDLGQIYFPKRQLLPFYSVCNQARLFLNGRWKLTGREEDFMEALSEEPELAWAIFRDRLFCNLQSSILQSFPDVL